MEMEFVGVVKTIVRWLWLIILIVAATSLFLFLNPSFSVVDYNAEVTLLFTTPDREDASVFNDYAFTNERDEVTIAINKFIEIAQYPEVRLRTLAELNIDEPYEVVLSSELGADFIYITVSASTPELSAAIANAHAANAIEYFGEIRAMPSNQSMAYFDTEIALAQEAVTDAENALNTFRTENNIVDLERELELQYDVLEELEISRAELLVYQVIGGRVSTTDLSQPIIVTDAEINSLDILIDEQRTALAALSALEPQYNSLQTDLELAQEHRDYLTSQRLDVETRESFATRANFIQLIQPASVPTNPEDNTLKTWALGIAASLGLGILLAFFLDYLTKRW